jgi:quercetin dioxygenase-like cupin family protein
VRCGAISFAAGDSVEEHAHRTSDEVFYAISGSGRITVEGKSVDVQPGDLLFIVAGERHAIQVSESATEPFVIFAAVAPNTNDDTVFTARSEP